MSVDIAVDETGFRKSDQYTLAFHKATFNGILMWPISVEWCKLIFN